MPIMIKTIRIIPEDALGRKRRVEDQPITVLSKDDKPLKLTATGLPSLRQKLRAGLKLPKPQAQSKIPKNIRPCLIRKSSLLYLGYVTVGDPLGNTGEQRLVHVSDRVFKTEECRGDLNELFKHEYAGLGWTHDWFAKDAVHMSWLDALCGLRDELKTTHEDMKLQLRKLAEAIEQAASYRRAVNLQLVKAEIEIRNGGKKKGST